MEKINRTERFVFVKSKQFVSLGLSRGTWSTRSADRASCRGVLKFTAKPIEGHANLPQQWARRFHTGTVIECARPHVRD